MPILMRFIMLAWLALVVIVRLPIMWVVAVILGPTSRAYAWCDSHLPGL